MLFYGRKYFNMLLMGFCYFHMSFYSFPEVWPLSAIQKMLSVLFLILYCQVYQQVYYEIQYHIEHTLRGSQ